MTVFTQGGAGSVAAGSLPVQAASKDSRAATGKNCGHMV
jgi:hypothetical protein